MSIYKELLIQQRKLDQKIAQSRDDETKAALVKVLSLVAEHGFTAQQVFPWKPLPVKPDRPKAELKFRNPVTGAGWSGRGREPSWLAGKDRSAYAVVPRPAHRTPS